MRAVTRAPGGSSHPVTRSVLERARAALAAARETPVGTLEAATSILDAASSPEVLATAHFACGLAHRTLANGAESTAHLEQAAEHATAFPELLGQILRSLAFNYAQTGDHARGDRLIERSIDLLAGQEADLSRLQQAFLMMMRGEHQAALPVLSAAIAGFTEKGADDYLELTLYNRALVYLAFGDYDSSIADLRRAYETAISCDHRVSAADAALHLSQVLGWCDDVPGAMRWQARSVELRRAAGANNPVADTEHAFVLIQARLMREAEQLLESSLPRLEAAGDNQAVLVTGRLLLIDVLLDKGDHAGALHQVELAAADTPDDGRWRFEVAAARHRVRTAAGEASVALLRSMMDTAADMAANGEQQSAAVERFRAVEVALAVDDLDTATQLLEEARRYTRSGPLSLQIQAWTAIAVVELATGNRRGAAAAVRAGIDRLDTYRSGIGATDLRMHAADYGEKLAGMGIELAIESGSIERLFSWSERMRFQPAPAALDHPGLGTALADLRRASAATRTAGANELTAARREVAMLEARVRQLGREIDGTRATAAATRPLRDVRARLGGQVLIEYVHSGPRLYAIVVGGRGSRLVELGDSAEAAELIDHLRFSAERIARPGTSAASRLAAIASAEEAIESLRRQLVAPLGVRANGAVVVPSGALYGIPWGMMFDIPVATVPSATAWLQAGERADGDGSPVVVTGPDLTHAEDEAGAISRITRAKRTSSVAETIALLPRSSLVHFACHAHPRADSPLFSSLVLGDGELTLYDIERLPRVPATIVLASCSGAGSVLASGDEVLSLAGSFLAMGARRVIAPVFTVSDEATSAVMSSMYRSLAGGADPATALLAAAESDDPSIAFTARSFSSYGYL